jgi:Protein of unknown function (DUF1579)
MRDTAFPQIGGTVKRTLILFVLLGLCFLAFAQSHKKHSRAAATAPAVPSAKQSAEMKKVIESLAGMWKTTTTVEPGGFMPQGGTATGRADIRSGPAGNALVERFRSHEGPFGNFVGQGTIWWDPNASGYRALWCDTLSPSGCDLMGVGQWDGNNLVFKGESQMEGKKMHTRETYSDITPDSFTFTMEMAVEGSPMQKAMTIKYERATPKSAATASQAEGKNSEP